MIDTNSDNSHEVKIILPQFEDLVSIRYDTIMHKAYMYAKKRNMI